MLAKIVLNGGAFFAGQLAVGGFDKGQRTHQQRLIAGFEPKIQAGGNQAGKH
ncbi:hypothetical protein D3C78_1983800 [compost metagenome]